MAKKVKSSRKATSRNRNRFHGARAPMNNHAPAFDLSAVIPGGKGSLKTQGPQLPAHLQGIDFKAIVEHAEGLFREGMMQAYASIDPIADMPVIKLVGELAQDLLKSIEHGKIPVKEQFQSMLFERLDQHGLDEVKAMLGGDEDGEANLGKFFSAFSRESLQMVKNMQAAVQSQAKPIAQEDLQNVAAAARQEALVPFRAVLHELVLVHFPTGSVDQLATLVEGIVDTLPTFTEADDESGVKEQGPEEIEAKVIRLLGKTELMLTENDNVVMDAGGEAFMNDFWNVYEDALEDYVQHIRTELGLNDFDGQRVEAPEADVLIGDDGVPTIVETGEGVHVFAQAIIDSGIDLNLKPLGLPDGEKVTLTQAQKDTLFDTSGVKASYPRGQTPSIFQVDESPFQSADDTSFKLPG